MKKNYLADYLQDRNNNLDILRLLAAVLVIFSHAFPLMQKVNDNEPIFLLTGQTTFGGIAVAAFFIISGFLITQSFERSSSLFSYFKKRFLRIFPGLIFCILFASFVLGPILTTLPINEYFSNSLVYKYLIGISLLPNLSPSLPGLFDSNPFGSFVNGSLWTLKFEFLFYIAVALFGAMKLLKKSFVWIFFIAFVLLSIPDINSDLHNLFMLGSFFGGGMLLYLYRDQVRLKFSFALISCICIVIASQLGLLIQSIAVFGSYLIIYLGYQQKITFTNFTKYGDISYGTYIFAFPVQQAIIVVAGSNITPFTNFILSLPFIISLAFLSWHLVEKPSLKLKHSTQKLDKRSQTPHDRQINSKPLL